LRSHHGPIDRLELELHDWFEADPSVGNNLKPL